MLLFGDMDGSASNHKAFCLTFPTALIIVLLLAGCGSRDPTDIRVAVASNFSETARELSTRFEKKTGRRITLLFGSTGKHFAQINAGAAVDVFMAADSKYPKLVESGFGLPKSDRVTYAYGRLVLWSPKRGLIDQQGKVLNRGQFRKIAVANPRLAPYGIAAIETLKSLGLLSKLESRLVSGENVGQAFQFVNSGNADLGFVAYSQVISVDKTGTGSIWIVPAHLYAPIEQQAVLLSEKDGAREFFEYLETEEASEIIRRNGYGKP